MFIVLRIELRRGHIISNEELSKKMLLQKARSFSAKNWFGFVGWCRYIKCSILKICFPINVSMTL